MRIYLPSDTEIQRQRDSDRGGATYRERDRDRNRQGMRQSQRETETKTAKARQRQTETNGQTVTDRQTGGAARVRPTDLRGRGRIRAGQKEGDPKGGRKWKAENGGGGGGGGVRVASLPE